MALVADFAAAAAARRADLAAELERRRRWIRVDARRRVISAGAASSLARITSSDSQRPGGHDGGYVSRLDSDGPDAA